LAISNQRFVPNKRKFPHGEFFAMWFFFAGLAGIAFPKSFTFQYSGRAVFP
jgi:hypothetical protein